MAGNSIAAYRRDLNKFAIFLGRKPLSDVDPQTITDFETTLREAHLSVASINTADSKRDEHLKSPEFLDAAKYQDLTFVTTSVEPVSADVFKAHGDLTIRGVTKPVTLDVTFGGAAKDPWGNERAAFSASTKINRKDFGLTWSKAIETGALVVGDEVAITLEIEGIKS